MGTKERALIDRNHVPTDDKVVHFENLDTFLVEHKNLAQEAKDKQFPWKQSSNIKNLSFRAKGFEKRLEKFAKGESSKLVSTPKRWTGSKYWPFGEDKQNLQDMTEVSKNNKQITVSDSRDEEYFESFTRKKSFRSKDDKSSSGFGSFFFRSKTLETSADSTPATSFRLSPSAKNKAEAQWQAAQGGGAVPDSPTDKKKRLAPQNATRRDEWDDELADYEHAATQQTRRSQLSPVMSGTGTSDSEEETGHGALVTSDARDGAMLLGQASYNEDDATISSMSVAPSVDETAEMRRVREMNMMREQRLREAEVQGTQASARINKPAFRDHLDVALSSKKMATAEL